MSPGRKRVTDNSLRLVDTSIPASHELRSPVAKRARNRVSEEGSDERPDTGDESNHASLEAVSEGRIREKH